MTFCYRPDRGNPGGAANTESGPSGESVFVPWGSRHGSTEERSTARSPVDPAPGAGISTGTGGPPSAFGRSALGATGSQPERAHRMSKEGAKGMPKDRLKESRRGQSAGRSV